MNLDELREFKDEKIKDFEGGIEDEELEAGRKGSIIGLIRKCAGGSDDDRKDIIEWWFNTRSTKGLSDAQWWVLEKWTDQEEDLNIKGYWMWREELVDEVRLILDDIQG